MKKIFQKVGNTSIVPISLKILLVFTVLMLLSNFVTNYINIQLSRKETVSLTNTMLVKELKEIYNIANNQYDIALYSKNKESAAQSLSAGAEKTLAYPNSRAFGITPKGVFIFQAAQKEAFETFPDTKILESLVSSLQAGVSEGSFFFNAHEGEYLGVYKYHDKWDMFIVRSDLLSDLLAESNRVFINISIIIVVLTIIFVIFGFFIINYLLRFIKHISNRLYEMQGLQELELIDLSKAPNDDVTYLGMSFNSLSSSIDNLVKIFRKFASKDLVDKAYLEHEVRLEGERRELTVLFSDIRGFTYMTETLGNDIITLLNIHYTRAIGIIDTHQGIIGSIIGDAVLAVYGAMDSQENKSLEALRSAWAIQTVASDLRSKLIERKSLLEDRRHLTEVEERVFKAILIDVGVGIDGGVVFYGTVGSDRRMTNTVIGDNVNSSSRLEGLTRIYNLPIIVSEYVKCEVESCTAQYHFFEIDTVQVKGKTEGKKIFFPLDTERYSTEEIAEYEVFSQGLQAYYEGRWDEARRSFALCRLKVCDIFTERMGDSNAPYEWSGIWAMTSK